MQMRHLSPNRLLWPIWPAIPKVVMAENAESNHWPTYKEQLCLCWISADCKILPKASHCCQMPDAFHNVVCVIWPYASKASPVHSRRVDAWRTKGIWRAAKQYASLSPQGAKMGQLKLMCKLMPKAGLGSPREVCAGVKDVDKVGGLSHGQEAPIIGKAQGPDGPHVPSEHVQSLLWLACVPDSGAAILHDNPIQIFHEMLADASASLTSLGGRCYREEATANVKTWLQSP